MMSLCQVCVQTSFGASDLLYSMNHTYCNTTECSIKLFIFSVVIHKTGINSQNDPLVNPLGAGFFWKKCWHQYFKSLKGVKDRDLLYIRQMLGMTESLCGV